MRTAGGKRNGRLSGWHPVDMAAEVIDELVRRTSADPALVDDVFMGCVSQIGEQSSNIARNAVLVSVLPESVPGTTMDRQCGSSQQAVHFAAQAVMSGVMDVVIAAGIESMSRVPMFSPVAVPEKAGMGHYFSRRMHERYTSGVFSQFIGAEVMAEKYGLSKNQLDEFALLSHQRALAATNAGLFKDEILPLDVLLPNGSKTGELHSVDEGIRFDASLERIAGVKLITEGGRVSAAAASHICDGASGVLIVNERGLKALGVKPLARIHHMTVHGSDPVIVLETPIPATERALKKAGLKIEDIDLYEVNEAFAPVPLAWLKTLGADPARLNVNGGAIALGHPLGASGTRLLTTLVYALQQRRKRYGLQTMCEAGGMANVTLIERL